MDVRRAEVEVLAAASEDRGRPDKVDGEADARDDDQPAAGNVGRVGEASHRADEHDQRDHDQRDGVDERRENLRPPEPEAAIRRRRPAREENRPGGDAERDDVREVVTRVREQGKAARGDRGDRLEERVGGVEDERDRQRAEGAAAVMMVQAGAVRVVVTVGGAHTKKVVSSGHARRAEACKGSGLTRGGARR